jgi:Flp pilus assembly protein protease CpaA
MFFGLLVLRQAFLLAGSGAAAWTDARTGLILDKITYPMIIAGILFNLLEQQWLWLGIGLAVFVLGYVVYYMGKFGGGDVKLFTGIAFLLPFYQNGFFLLNVLFAACLLGITFYSAYFVAKYVRKGVEWGENRKGLMNAVFFGLAIAIYLAGMVSMEVFGWQTALVLAFPLMLALLFLAFEKGIRKSFFLKNVRLGKLEEDEVVAADFLGEKAKKALGMNLKGLLGDKEIEKLKKAGIKEVPVFRGMPPFGPFIFLGCVVAMLMPDLFGVLF